MTTQTLRNQITVTNWNLTSEMMTISYFRSYNGKSKPMHIILQPNEYLKELDILCSIDEYNERRSRVVMDEREYELADFLEVYKMSQWDALCIAIRHEETLTIESELDLLYFNSEINDLKDRLNTSLK